MIKSLWKLFLAGVALLVPTWATILVLFTLFKTLDNILGDYMNDPFPGIGLLLLAAILVLAGILADHVIGEQILKRLEQRVEHIPLIQSLYATLKGMTDLINFRSRFNQRQVVAFPFPRNGLWALGFVMGTPPPTLHVPSAFDLQMVFVPTAIHPFTGYLALIPEHALVRLDLPPEEAMKMEFSAGFYQPRKGWLDQPRTTT